MPTTARVLICLMIALALPPAAARAAQDHDTAATEQRWQEVQQTVRRHIDAGAIPGAITLVARNGRIEYLAAQGALDATRPTPLRKDTIFWMASMTKPIIATAVMMLVEEGKLRLEDPVSKYIPEFRAPALVRVLRPGSVAPSAPAPNAAADPNAAQPQYDFVPANRSITLQDLLTHTSGLQTIGVPNEAIPALTEGATLASWVPKLVRVPLDFQPGSKWAYSNATGFEVLARTVEIASGQPLNQFVKQRIFVPLAMHDSSFGPQARLAARTMALDPRFGNNPCIAGTTYFCGSAGLWMTAADYWHFAQMLLDQGTTHGKRLLRPESIKLMTSNQVGELFPGSSGVPGSGAGFGLSMLMIRDAAAAGLAVPSGSFGWDGVGTRRFWVMPEKHAVLVMLIPSGKATPVHRDIERAVMTVLQSAAH